MLRYGIHALTAAAILAGTGSAALAEGKIAIAEQHGISYLPFHVIRDQKLLEKYGAEQGLEIEAEWAQISGGGAVNDALLSGAVDIASAGVGPLLTIWDRTYDKQNVRGIFSGARFPAALITSNPNVKTLADFTDQDKIALPTVGVSVQARTLQYAAAQLWGQDKAKSLDKLTVTLPHPEATQALLAGSGTITAHFSNAPFQEQALRSGKVHQITDSYEIFGGPTSSLIVYTTEKYRTENPKTYGAFLDAYIEAAAWVKDNPEAAADLYVNRAESSIDRDLIVSILKDERYSFDPVPVNTEKLAHFMFETGAIKHEPTSWRDYFFDDLHAQPGS